MHEGYSNVPYTDTKGYWTIGIGHCFDARITGDKAKEFEILDYGATDLQILAFFESDLNNVIYQLDRCIIWWSSLGEIYQRILIDMCFNLGIDGLEKFRKMLAALANLNYEEAAKEMENSNWYDEVGSRARRLTRWMRNGYIDEPGFV